ncbi:alpha/beta fold hydrolase [Cellulomonas aerilata]|uniref:alpha/beta fold hydrolase n=1 Tax=Cellulomonas aerilata TaxID=515326 RepID=UPI0011BFCDE2|nr:alpha/beta hydrolase [Cellulomonas aerilata]
MHQVSTRLGRLAVREYSTREDQATGSALLWHSMFTDSRSWSRVAPALAEHRRLLIVDGPGYGHSAELTRRSSIEESAEAAVQVLESLQDGPVDWVGNAWGGHTGLHLAATAPQRVRSLVAISSPVQPVSRAERRQIELMTRLLRVVGPVGPLRDAIAAVQLADPRGSLRPLVDSGLRTLSRRSLANTVDSFIVGRTDLSWALPLITAPTLVVATDAREDFTPEQAEATARAIPGGRWTVVHGSGVLAPLEQPAWTAETIIDFWTSLDGV